MFIKVKYSLFKCLYMHVGHGGRGAHAWMYITCVGVYSTCMCAWGMWICICMCIDAGVWCAPKAQLTVSPEKDRCSKTSCTFLSTDPLLVVLLRVRL